MALIKEWATYHLIKAKSHAKEDDAAIHQYKLCCVCYVLLFEDSFVRMGEKEHYDIFKKAEGNKFYCITDGKYTNQKSGLPDPCPVPDEEPLSSWINLFQHCNPINDCVDLYNKREEEKIWTIGNRYGTERRRQENKYNYKYKEFLLVMGALSDMCLNRENTLRELCYHVSKFKNGEEDFQIKSFSDDANDIDKTIVEELSTYVYPILQLMEFLLLKQGCC